MRQSAFPVDKGRKLNVHKTFKRRHWTLSECLMYGQVTSCVQDLSEKKKFCRKDNLIKQSQNKNF